VCPGFNKPKDPGRAGDGTGPLLSAVVQRIAGDAGSNIAFGPAVVYLLAMHSYDVPLCSRVVGVCFVFTCAMRPLKIWVGPTSDAMTFRMGWNT
jgi:hypothetical protein